MINPAYRRRRWPLFSAIGVVVVAAAWSGLWFYAAARAKTEIAAWREDERARGRSQDCASLSIGGYPFRIEVRCESSSFELKGKPTLKLDLPYALARVQVYDPRLITGEFTAPLVISEPGLGTDYVATWNFGQARVRGLPSEPARASFVFDALLVRDASMPANEAIFTARRFELQGRRAGSSDSAVIETVLRMKGAVGEKIHPVLGKPIDADVSAFVRGLDDITPKPWPLRFRELQANGGAIEITSARIAQEDVIAVGTGALALTPRGGLQGNLQVTVVGIEQVLKMFDLERLMSEGQIGTALGALDRLMPGLGGFARQNAAPGLIAALGQRTVLEGKPAVTLPIRFVDGAIFLGPFPVGTAPPLF